jgi:hypothetical protein
MEEGIKMQDLGKTAYLCFILLAFSVSPLHAAVLVYTDRAAWEAAASASPVKHFTSNTDFESAAPGPLYSGINHIVGSGVTIEIAGDPGSNRIEDDPSDPLSPNGSKFYAGEVDGSAPDAGFPALSFGGIGPPGQTKVLGFGADWVGTTGQDGLTMNVAGTTIVFSNYLPTGSGFLGVLAFTQTDINPVVLGTEIPGGTQLFGMDNITHLFTPVPPAVLLFGSGLLGLIGIARRKDAI